MEQLVASLALLGGWRRIVMDAVVSCGSLVMVSILNHAAGLDELLAGAGRLDAWEDIPDGLSVL